MEETGIDDEFLRLRVKQLERGKSLNLSSSIIDAMFENEVIFLFDYSHV